MGCWWYTVGGAGRRLWWRSLSPGVGRSRSSTTSRSSASAGSGWSRTKRWSAGSLRKVFLWQFWRVELEVDQPIGSTYLLHVDWQIGSTCLGLYIAMRVCVVLCTSALWQIHSLPSPMFFLTTCLSCELRWQPRKARLRNQCFTAIIVILPNILTSGEGSCLDFLDELLPYITFLSQTSAFILQLEQDSWCIVQTKWIRSLASALTSPKVCFISRVW